MTLNRLTDSVAKQVYNTISTFEEGCKKFAELNTSGLGKPYVQGSFMAAMQIGSAAVEVLRSETQGVGDPDNEINEISCNIISDAVSLFDPSDHAPGERDFRCVSLEAMQIQMNKDNQAAWATTQTSEAVVTEAVLNVAASA